MRMSRTADARWHGYCFGRGCKQRSTRDDITIMNAFSPEFAQHWLAGQGSRSDDPAAGRHDDPLSPAQEEALEELAHRVNAARTVF